jgi:hypothetical protein
VRWALLPSLQPLGRVGVEAQELQAQARWAPERQHLQQPRRLGLPPDEEGEGGENAQREARGRGEVL